MTTLKVFHFIIYRWGWRATFVISKNEKLVIDCMFHNGTKSDRKGIIKMSVANVAVNLTS